MNSDTVLQYCDQIDTLVQQIRDEVTGTGPEPPEPPIDTVVVGEGEDLQAALDAGGAIALEEGAGFSNHEAYRVTQSGTALTGQGSNAVETTHDHAFDVPITVDDLTFAQFALASPAPEAFQLGVNGTSQDTVDKAPSGVIFRAITSSGHRGKRVFDVNAANVQFLDCDVRDCYSPDGMDSQAICVLNAPGPVLIDGGYYEGASENVMVGGDTMKIPNCRPTGITIRKAKFTKRPEWKTAGTPKVKNLLEFKDGEEVLVDECELWCCWKSAQDGYCFMCTPSNGGSVSVVIKKCVVWDVGGIVNITGTDASAINPKRTQVTIQGGDYRTNPDMGGSERFVLATRGPEWIVIEDMTSETQGTFMDLCDDKKPIDLVRLVGSTWYYGSYGIRIGGYNHGDNQLGLVRSLQIEGNTIHGAHSSFKNRYPHNTYVDVMSREQEQFVDSPAEIEEYRRRLREEIKRHRD